ncbi:MAG: TetR/AcrR family transcriptional regulator [Lachnospiraceae bacterium]|nr:TetR/AcrR family transcriptional regulator [Lachnospiraceae bacterium]
MPQPIKEEDLKNITKKVYALYAKHGFDGISMDEVCAQTNISKATLYRYFTSKEDIVRSMVDVLISHLNTLQFDAIDGIGNVLDGFQKVYIKSTIIAALTGSEFLTALEKSSRIRMKRTIRRSLPCRSVPPHFSGRQ